MNPEPKNSDVLQNLELAVLNVWRQHPEMNDYAAARAYEAAFEHYRAEARGHEPKGCALTGLDREAFEAVMSTCELRLGRANERTSDSDALPAIPVPELVDCLRQLRKSVERHTKATGRQGYLTFVDQFVH